MKTKQVNDVAPASAPQQNNLYLSVRTFNPEGKDIGFRIVDLYHFGTRKWMQDHLWWALHHGNLTEINVATPPEIDQYLADAKLALAEKFGQSPQTAAEEPQDKAA